jgi:adenylate cyclase
MDQPSNKLSRFWQELKRRNVIRVLTVYAGVAFVIIELVNNITEPLRLPEWTPTFVIVLLAIGLPVVIIFSWVYDIHPEEGLVKTQPAHKVKAGDIPKSSNGWKIASYISFVVIMGLILLNIFGGNRGPRIDESLAKSIAVLPFLNFSGDPDQDYMCEGLTDEIISHLFKIRSFDEVRSLTSVLPYKDSEKSIREIAEALNVNYILEGSYKRMGDNLKITAQLIEPGSDNHIWLHDYELAYNQVIGIPGDIALQIADHLRAFISETEQTNIGRNPTDNIEAYELVQKTVSYFFHSDHELNFHIRDTLLKAIDLDPEYATPYAAMATFSIFRSTGLGGPIADFNFDDAITYNQTALRLDPENIAAILNQAIFELWINWDYIKVEEYYQKAFSIVPNTRDELLIDSYREFLFKMRQYERILPYLGPMYNKDDREIQVYAALDQPQKAESLTRRYSEEGKYTQTLFEYYIWEEEYELARNILDSVIIPQKVDLNFPMPMAYMALVRDKTGDPSTARSFIENLKTWSETSSNGMAEFNLGRYYSGVGKVDSAFIWLEKAFDEHCVEMSWIKGDPLLYRLNDDERYWNLYDRTGHKAYDDYLSSR